VITLQQIARAAGCSLATVSYALRGDLKIRPATRARVQQVAEQLGYRPNPRFSALMSHIRNARPVAAGERIAFVWVHTSRRLTAENLYLRLVFEGARARAERLGFALEEFWTDDPGMTARRLQEIIVARGITGVLLSPVLTPETALALDWDWSRFAAVVIGNVTWTPELHHVGHHHFLAMRTALAELAKLGCARPAAIVDAVIDERAKHAWTAAFLAHHPQPARARQLLQLAKSKRPPGLGTWLDQSGADALIVSAVAQLSAPGVRAVCREKQLQVVSLRWAEGLPAAIAGIDQCDDLLGSQAVELLIAQLHHNERGPPRHPGMMLFPGRWVAASLARVGPA
jgi:LacI family transcriptional regulator